ncbi:MAG: hypothetical protein E6Q97_09310 [Desulfurellales bacterium]|nr:MAG: hypothetical protein E6Q97_09310 [Desulfurellales bacterium]
MNRNAQTLYSPIPKTSQAKTTGAASAESDALPALATGVRLYATKACRVNLDGGTAGATDVYLPAEKVEYFPIPASAAGGKIAYIQDSESGTLHITPLSE